MMRPLRRAGPSADVLWEKNVVLARRSQTRGDEVREALSGHLCRCTGYKKPVEAIMAAAWVIGKANGKANGKKKAKRSRLPAEVTR